MHIEINIQLQSLSIISDGKVVKNYLVSTAVKGAGEVSGSQMTPRGLHYIRAKIGSGCLKSAVFSGRRPTGQVLTPQLASEHPSTDWILTRILWLCGLERGRNRGGDVDSMRRYIYIHGAPDTEPMGIPLSHGCIRMRNSDVMDLFDKVDVGVRVFINEFSVD